MHSVVKRNDCGSSIPNPKRFNSGYSEQDFDSLGNFYEYEFDDLVPDELDENPVETIEEPSREDDIILIDFPDPIVKPKPPNKPIQPSFALFQKRTSPLTLSQKLPPNVIDYSMCENNYARPPYTVLKLHQPQLDTLKFIRDKHSKVLEDVARLEKYKGDPQCSRGVLIANDMGCGKTATAIQFFVDVIREHVTSGGSMDKFPRILIVCPKTLVGNWRNEASTHFKHIGMLDASSMAVARHGDLRAHSVIITTYTRISAETKYIQESAIKRVKGNSGTSALLELGLFKYAVFDESQTLKNPLSGFSKSAGRLKYVTFTILLSATPLENKMDELSQQLSMIQIPGYPSPKHFKSMDIESKIAHLQKYMEENMFRRTMEKPKLLIFNVFVKLAPLSARAYEMELNQLSSTLKGNTDEHDTNKHKLQTLSNLRIICSTGGGTLLSDYKWENGKIDITKCDPPSDEFKNRGNERFVKLSDGTRFSIGKRFVHEPTSKMLRMAQIVKHFKSIDPTTKFLLFSEYTATLESFCEFINTHIVTDPNQQHGRAVVLRGSVPTEMRNRVMDTYADPDGNVDFLCCITDLIGYGTNLQAGNVVFFGDEGFNPQMSYQAMHRCCRKGQKKACVYVFRLRSTYDSSITSQATGRETVEQQIGRRHCDKQVIFNVLINGEGSKEDIIKAAGSMTAKIGKSAQLKIINDELAGYENVITLSVHQPAKHTDEWEDWLFTQSRLQELHARGISNSKITGSFPLLKVTEQEITELETIPKGAMLFSLDISKYPLLYLSKIVDRICFASLNSLCKYLYNLMCNTIFQSRRTHFEQSLRTTTLHGTSACHDVLRFSDEAEYIKCTEAFQEAFKKTYSDCSSDPGVFDGLWELDISVYCVKDDISLAECKVFQAVNLMEGFINKVQWAETGFVFVPVYTRKKFHATSSPMDKYPILPFDQVELCKKIRMQGNCINRMSKSSLSVESVLGVQQNILPVHESFFGEAIESEILTGIVNQEVLQFSEAATYMSLLESCSYQWRNLDCIQRDLPFLNSVPQTYISARIPSWSHNCLTEIVHDTHVHHHWVMNNYICHGSDGAVVEPACVLYSRNFIMVDSSRKEVTVSISASNGKLVLNRQDCTKFYQSCRDHDDCNYRVYEKENSVCGVLTRKHSQISLASQNEPFIVYCLNASHCQYHSLSLTILECNQMVSEEMLGEFFGGVLRVHLLRIFTRIKPINHLCGQSLERMGDHLNFFLDIPNLSEISIALEDSVNAPELYCRMSNYLEGSGRKMVDMVKNSLDLHHMVDVCLAHTIELGLNSGHSVSFNFLNRTKRSIYGNILIS